MKKTFCILLLCSSGLAVADERFTNHIWVEHEDGTEYPLYVAPSGTQVDTRGVLGSVKYTLFTIKNEDNSIYTLDEKTVSSYHPQSSIKITSADPYEAIPRTRVDQPFNIEYHVAGIVTDDPEVQDAAKSVIFDHRMVAYPSGGTEAAVDAVYEVHDHDPLTANGTFHINNVMTEITSDNLPDTRGEEIFSIYANPDWGVTETASLLAQQRVQIWPIAKGTVSGIDTTAEYAKLPEITVALTDLYPSSTTYLRVYKGSPVESPQTVIKINTSFVIIDDVVPVDRTFVLNQLDSKIAEDAVYTVELIHETPFGADLLAQIYPFNIKRSIKVNGNVNSSE